MSIADRKIEAFTSPVSSLPDQPVMSAEALKEAFDSPAEELRAAIDGLIDDLLALTGAGEIGSTAIEGLEGTTVRAQIVALMALKIASTNVKGIRLGSSGYLEYTPDGTTWTTPTYPGSGDMNRIVYDTDLNGVVDDSGKLGGHAPEYFAEAAKDFTGTLLATGWSGTGPYTQTVTVEGLAADMPDPIVDITLSSVLETRQLETEAWGLVSLVEVGDNTLTATCDEAAPETDLNLRIKVVY